MFTGRCGDRVCSVYPTACESPNYPSTILSCGFAITIRQSPRRRFVILLPLTNCSENAGCHSPAHPPDRISGALRAATTRPWD